MMSAAVDALADTMRAPPSLVPATVKVCSCGREYTAHGWSSLPLVGTMPGADDQPIQLRNCVGCGSTIAIEMCVVTDCDRMRSWTAEGSLDGYCDDHVNEWLRAEESKR